jgi:hypothetical protein
MVNWTRDKDDRMYVLEEQEFTVIFGADTDTFSLYFERNSRASDLHVQVVRDEVELSCSPAPLTLGFLERALKAKRLPRGHHEVLTRAVQDIKGGNYKFFDLYGTEFAPRVASQREYVERRRERFGAGLSDGLTNGLAFTDEVEQG